MRRSILDGKLLIALVLLAGAAYLLKGFIKIPSTESAILYPSWQYRMPIYIYEQSGTNLTNYQVLITVNTESLISQGKMRSDCGDIRFSYVDSSGNEIPIPYWIESGCNSPNTKIWIKVPFIPANGTAKVYMYYGNPDAVSASNGNQVFEFFEDFSGTSLDSSKWHAIASLYNLGFGYIVMSGSWVKPTPQIISTVPNFTLPIVVEARERIGGLDTVNLFIGWRANYTDTAFEGFECVMNGGKGVKYIYDPILGAAGASDGSLNTTSWIHVKIAFLPNKIIFWDNILGTLVYNLTTYTLPLTGYLGIGVNSVSYPGYIDYLFVRKYAAKEPLVQFGTEEYRPPVEGQFSKLIQIESKFAYERGETASIVVKYNGLVDANYVQIEILNKTGAVVLPKTNMTRLSPGLYVYDWSTKGVAPGIYIVKVYAYTNGTVLKQVATIKVQTTKEDIMNYLTGVIYPTLIELRDMLEKIQGNQLLLYSELLRIHDKANKTYEKLLELSSNVSEMNETLLNKLYEIKNIDKQILENTTMILDRINNIILPKLDEVRYNTSKIIKDVEVVNQNVESNYAYLSGTIKPLMDDTIRRLMEINSTAVETKKLLQEHNITVLEKIDMLSRNVNVALDNINKIENMLGCTVTTNNSVCTKLDEIKTMLNGTKSVVDDIKTITENTNDYLKKILGPKVDQIITTTNKIMSNLTASYNELIAVHSDVKKLFPELENMSMLVKNVNTTLYQELQKHMERLTEINKTVTEILKDIQDKVIPMLNNVLYNLSIALNNTNELLVRTNCVNIQENTVCSYLNDIKQNTIDIKNTLSNIKNDVATLQPIPTRLETIISKTNDINNKLDNLKDIVSNDIKPKVDHLAYIFKHNVTPQVKMIVVTLGNYTIPKQMLSNATNITSPRPGITVAQINVKKAAAAGGLLGLLLLLAMML